MPSESVIRKKCLEELESCGWITWYPSKVKFKQNDIFGIIDLLALKGKNKKNIQLTTLSNLSARRKKIISFIEKNKIQITVEIWAWNKRDKTFKKVKIKG